MKSWFLVLIVLIKSEGNDYSGTEIMLAQRLQAKPVAAR